MQFEQQLVSILQKTITKHPSTHEIEVRLGKRVKTKSGHNRFDPNLGPDRFNLLVEQLVSEYPNTYETYEFNEYKIGTLRLRLDKDGVPMEFIRKKRLSNDDIEMGNGYYARVSVSEESEMKEQFRGTPRTKPIHKKRHVFKDNQFQFELTAATRDVRGQKKTDYYLEVEVLGH